MAIDSSVYGYMVDEHEYPDKKVILEEGSIGDWVYVVLEGQVKIKKKTAKGLVTLATLEEGAIFGEIPLFLKREKLRETTVQAHGPVKVGILDTSRLDREFELLSPQLKGLIKTLARRLSESIEKISQVAGR
ncbi:MAG: cyclic nucleotide-binding domain-containing protein [Deltaproteobacteria bacterium]|nr:cyclic nucleotide-binding domain-containing protein [Deltaproteobacteria bacterium]